MQEIPLAPGNRLRGVDSTALPGAQHSLGAHAVTAPRVAAGPGLRALLGLAALLARDVREAHEHGRLGPCCERGPGGHADHQAMATGPLRSASPYTVLA